MKKIAKYPPRDPAGPDEHSSQVPTCVIEGIRLFETFCEAGISPLITYVTEEALRRYPQLSRINTTLVGERRMKHLSSMSTPSGVLGFFAIPVVARPIEWSRALVLVQIQDPGNMGTLIRTAAAMGVQDVIIVEGANPWSSKVLQAAAGAHVKVAIRELPFEAVVQQSTVPLAALVTQQGISPKTCRREYGPVVLVVGNEAHGLPHEWVNAMALRVTIPMPGEIESLNAAVAGSIALYAIFGPE